MVELVGGFAVYFVGGDVEETLDGAEGLHGLEEDVRAADVVLRELEGVAEGVVDVGLRREVHHRVDLLAAHDVRHEIGGADVALDELEVHQARHGAQVVQVGAVVKLVDDDNLVLRVLLGEEDRDVRGDEARAAGDQHIFRLVHVFGTVISAVVRARPTL